MSIILEGLKYLAYILIFPGFLFCFLSGRFCSRSMISSSSWARRPSSP